MATKKAQTKSAKSTRETKSKLPYEPAKVTFGVAALAAVTLVVFALLLATQL
jgi:hypothetical protein